MKQLKKCISLILCVLILSSAICITAFAEETEPSYYLKYKHYTYFGDSVAAGVAVGTDMDDYYARMGFMRIPNCYTDLVADDIGYPDDEYNYKLNKYNFPIPITEVSPSATVGVRVCDLRMLLERCMVLDEELEKGENFIPFIPEGDTYYELNGSNYYFYYNWFGGMEERAVSVLPTVKDSDLFTIGLGSNDIFTCPITLMLNDPDFVNLLMGQGILIDLNTENRGFAAIEENLGAIYNAICSTTEMLETFLGYAYEGLSDIYNNYAALIDDIRALNGENNADIILVGLYNPFSGMKVTPNSNTSILCDTFNLFTGLINDFIAGIANSYEGVYFVDVSQTESLEMDLKDAVMDGDLWSIFTNIHPTRAGHRYMADQVLRKLEEINACSHEHTQLVFAKRATLLKPGYSGDVFCTDCGCIIKYGEITTALNIDIPIPRLTIMQAVKLTVNTISSTVSSVFTKVFNF